MIIAVRLGFGVAVAIGLAATAGCGPQKETVTGKVTYQGKAVVSGNVSLVASDNIMYPGPIGSDGTYTIFDVPVGPVKIGVSSPNQDNSGKVPGTRGGKATIKKTPKGLSADTGGGDRKSPSQEPKPSAGSWFAIPTKYADPMQSGLTDVVKAHQPLNIDLP